MESRDYQEKAVFGCLAKLEAFRSVLLVAPTGGGKTFMMAECVRRLPGRTAWVAHTQELVEQTARKLRSYGLRVGMIAAGFAPDPFAPVQVASVQTLLARDHELRVENLVLDEAHHYLAQEWRQAIETRHVQRTLGGTATPERADGKALGDIFRSMVVAAHYSELIQRGYLTPVRLLRPARELERGLAQKFVNSYVERGEGRPAFGYCRTVKEAEAMAEALTALGHPFRSLTIETPKAERMKLLAGVADGTIRGLTSVHALSEGVDVPEVSCGILGGNIGHVVTYLQRVGRVIRAARGKTDAMVIDLPGVSHRLGLPCEDREYSLEGNGIRRTEAGKALRVCLACGMTFEPRGEGSCPRCGHHNPVQKIAPPRIYNEALEVVYAGAETPDWAKRGELDRLRAVAHSRGLGLAWAAREYKNLFGEKPVVTMRSETTDDEKKLEYERLKRMAGRRSYQHGWVLARYKATFGTFPPRSWG